jgi:hypothetical protein
MRFLAAADFLISAKISRALSAPTFLMATLCSTPTSAKAAFNFGTSLNLAMTTTRQTSFGDAAVGCGLSAGTLKESDRCRRKKKIIVVEALLFLWT